MTAHVPPSERIRLHGEDQSERAQVAADMWRSWAEQLDELIREMPHPLVPAAWDGHEVTVLVPMGAGHMSPDRMRSLLYRVVADADAVAAALTRAAGLVFELSSEMARAAADEEAAEGGAS